MKVKELQKKFNETQALERARIREEPKKGKRFWKWVWYVFVFPWKWAFVNIRDWRTAVIFLIVVLLYSGSVWGFYLGALFCGWTSTDAGKWLVGVGSAVWVWWLSPAGSPFILLCVSTTIGVKAIFDAIKARKERRKVNTKEEEKNDAKRGT